MVTAILLLEGFLIGGLVVHLLIVASERRVMHARGSEEHYRAAARATLRHLRAHGTLNRVQLARMMDVPGATATRHLDRMVQDGILVPQRHRGRGTFYTRA